MDFTLTSEQREWQMKAREFADKEIAPISLARDAIDQPRETFDWDVIKKGSKLGFRTAAVPKEWGGHGIDFVTQALVMAELARGDSAVSKTFSQCWKWSHLIAAACTEDQKQRFLKPFLADDTFVLGKGGTEPNGGSDNRLPPEDDPRAGFRLRAERDGDHWILNGEKAFIANGSIAKLFFIDVRTDPTKNIRQGGTLFMVPNDTPGFRVGKVFNKRGWRFYQNAELIFENARVPHANIVGDVNGNGRIKGAGSLSSGDMFGDLELAANALGVCDSACEQALAFVKSHQQGGRPLIEQQLYQLKVNKMHMLTEALRSFVLRVAWEHDAKIHSANAGLVMNYSSDIIQEVTEIGLDIFGAPGGKMHRGMEKLVRDGMIWTHLAGDIVQRMRVVRRHIVKH
jgi:alkylation response protein AidB-like acyl-CoA dehydrogenase